MTDSAPPASPLAVLRGPVACRRTGNALTLTGRAADCADEVLILTLDSAAAAVLPATLGAVTLRALDERHFRLESGADAWIVEAAGLHRHRDVGTAFYRAIPPHPVPLAKRLLWRLVLALAATRTGKRLLLALPRR